MRLATGRQALPSPLRNLLTPLCSSLGKVSRYSWARTSNRPGDEKYPGYFRCLPLRFCTDLPSSIARDSKALLLRRSCACYYAFKHGVYKGFYYPYNCPTLYNSCRWKAVKSADTRQPISFLPPYPATVTCQHGYMHLVALLRRSKP